MKPKNQTTMIDKLAFETDNGLGSAARIGMIVLQTDQTIEHELSRLLTAEDIALYHARIPNAMEVSPDTLRQMKADLPASAKLLPPSFSFDTIGYACTSGATMIGEDTVACIIQELHPQAKVSNPLSASKAGFAALGLRQLALITPYPPEVTLAMRDNLKKAGFDATIVASFDQSDDFTVARIRQQSVLDAVLKAGNSDLCDGVFISCTSLRTLDILSHAEAVLGKPVVSSNQALAWHIMRLSGIDHQPDGFGRLFKLE
jgi:maleate isomerase